MIRTTLPLLRIPDSESEPEFQHPFHLHFET